jgi:hypothetical protein
LMANTVYPRAANARSALLPNLCLLLDAPMTATEGMSTAYDNSHVLISNSQPRTSNAQRPTPNAQRPNAQRPTAQRPTPNAQRPTPQRPTPNLQECVLSGSRRPRPDSAAPRRVTPQGHRSAGGQRRVTGAQEIRRRFSGASRRVIRKVTRRPVARDRCSGCAAPKGDQYAARNVSHLQAVLLTYCSPVRLTAAEA